MTTLGRLLKVAFLERKWMTLGIVAGVATVAAAIGLMMTSGRLISMAALQPHIGMIGVAVVGVRFFGLSRGVFRYVERLISHQVTFRLLMRFRIWFFSALAPVAPKGLERYRSNELLGRLVSDVENLEHVFLKIIAPPLISILVAIPTVFIFSWLHWHLGVWMAGALIVAHLLPWFALGEGMKLSGQISDEQIRLKENWLDGFQGLSDLVAFDASHRFFGSLAQRTDDYLQTRARFLRHHEKQNLLMTTLLYATVLGVLYLGADLVLQQQLDGVNLALVVLGAMASFEATMTLPSALANMAGSLHSAKRVHEVMDAAVKDAVQIDYVPSASPVTHKGFDLKNINFDYTTDIPVFSGLSLSLEPGRVYAITGASGCGKSTLLSLLSGTRSPNKGQLTFLGQPLCNVREERLRRELSVVPQYRHVFSDTLRANLRIASPNASDVELKDALARAGLSTFVASLPEGLDTWVGDSGQRLSGGQAQRLALARTLLQRSPWMMFDEPTANLDSETASIFYRCINQMKKSHSIVMATHDIAGMAMADEVVFLDRGKLICQGAHDELLKNSDHYKRFIAATNDVLI